MRVIVLSTDPDGERPRTTPARRPDPRRRRRRRERGHRAARLRRRRLRRGGPRHRPAAARRPRRRLVAGERPRRAVAVRRSAASPSAGSRMPRRSPTRARPLDAPRRAPTQPGDTDFAWTRLTLWRAQLAAVLDQPPYEPVTARRGARRRPTRRRPRCSPPGCSCSCKVAGRASSSTSPATARAASRASRCDRASGAIELERTDAERRDPRRSRTSRPTTSRFPAATCATASPRSCAGSTLTTCSVRSSRTDSAALASRRQSPREHAMG